MTDATTETMAGFPLFLALWNRRQGQGTPDLHFRMAAWLEGNWSGGNRRLLLMAFRSGGKSTVAGLFAAWLLYRNPDLRILVLAADHNLAKKMVRVVRRVLERHPLTRHLKPDRPDQWAGERFTVRRRLELRDPSMMASGVSANITGSRADIVICDDVEVPNTCDTAEKRRELRERLSEIDFILSSGGTQLYIGTPHTFETIYARDGGEADAFLSGFTRLEIPVLDEAGQSAWPEKFSAQDIARMMARSGPNKFASQMMLRPVSVAEGRLDPSLLRVYGEDLEYAREVRTLYIGDAKLVSASAWWDPAFGSAKGDGSVLACVFTDEKGDYYLHRTAYLNRDAPCEGEDEATRQCREVARIARDLRLPSVCVEINGIGKFLPAILRNELARAKAPCAVMEISNRRPKDIRILEAFDTVLAARRLHVHASVLKTPLLTEMREWRPGASGPDDGLDAVAGALSREPVRIGRIYGRGWHEWMRGGASHAADTGFGV